MNALAESITDRLRALREVEAERAKPRAVVRQVTAITLVVLGAALAFNRSYFAPMGTVVGQIIAVFLIAAYLGSLAMLQRMSIPRTRERLIGTSSHG